MPLQKRAIPINFSQGLDTKSDPFQIPIGRFLSLENSVFTKEGLLGKRYGFKTLPTLPVDASYATTFNGDLTVIGTQIQALTANSTTWVNKGQLQPVSLSVSTLIRSNANQVQCDMAIAGNGLVCTVYTETTSSTAYKYAISDGANGQNVVAPTVISADATYGTPRVFYLGNYFIIVYTYKVSTTYHLAFISINSASLTVSSPTDISTAYTPATTVAWDGLVSNNNLYLAWNGNDGGGAVHICYLTSTLVQSSIVSFTSTSASMFSLCADPSNLNLYVLWYNVSGTTAKAVVLTSILVTVTGATTLFSSGTILNMTSSAKSGVCTFYYEVSNAYAYDGTIPSNFINQNTITQAGVVGTASVFLRSVGLASKAFRNNGVIYLAVTYSSNYQPTYFLVNGAAQIIAKFAYSNGGGYLTLGLPSVTAANSVAQFPYLIKDIVQAQNNTQGAASSTPVYSQTGINLITVNLATTEFSTSEIGNNLHLSGGFLWMYDGYLPVEHNFFLWPDNIETTYIAGSLVTPTGTFLSGSTSITVSSATGIAPGMTITDATNPSYIPTGTQVVTVVGTVITISKATTHAGSGDTLNIQGNIVAKPDGSTNTNAYYYQVTYEWSDNQGNIFRSAPSIPVGVTTSGALSAGTITVHVPYLRLTYKTANPVKIVIYRWSVAQQSYYQVTSIAQPQLNVTTSDALAFVDTLPDSSIIGNNLIYTTGGVVEDIAAPATNAMTLFDTRLWLVDAEDKNLLWFSKQVIESTPVEMSDLFTYYIAPTTGSQGSTGNIVALAPMDDKLIIFKEDALYYINGAGPDNTGANNQYSQPIFISSTVGSANQASIVFTPNGLMFQSDKGIWLLGRDLSTNYIGAAVEAYNQYSVTSALTVPGTNQVRFALSNGITLMYDYYYGQWGTFTNVAGVSATLYQGAHTFINSDGTVYQENPGSYLDGSNPVLMSWTTGWFNLAGLQGYQRIYEFYILGTYYTPHKLTMGIAYDYSPYPSQFVYISPNNYNGPYGSDPVLGSSTPLGGTPVREQWRVNVDQQRCQAFQLSMSESFDPFFQTVAGQGLTVSGINNVVGLKKGYVPQPAATTTG